MARFADCLITELRHVNAHIVRLLQDLHTVPAARWKTCSLLDQQLLHHLRATFQQRQDLIAQIKALPDDTESLEPDPTPSGE